MIYYPVAGTTKSCFTEKFKTFKDIHSLSFQSQSTRPFRTARRGLVVAGESIITSSLFTVVSSGILFIPAACGTRPRRPATWNRRTRSPDREGRRFSSFD